MSVLSPVMTIAGAGLLPNPPADVGVALAIPTALANAVGTYTSVPVISQLQGIWGNVGNSLTQSTFVSLLTMGANNFPAVTGVVPSSTPLLSLLVNGLYLEYDNTVKYVVGNTVAYTGNAFIATDASQNEIPTANSAYWNINIDVYSLPGIVTTDANALLGNGDLDVFCQVFSGAQGYVSQSNYNINAVNNSDILVTTFDVAKGGMTTLTTGALNQVSTDLLALSADLIKLGKLIDLTALNSFGLPGTLLAQIGKICGGIPPSIAVLLVGAGISESQILLLAAGVNPLSPSEEKLAYSAMEKIVGSALDQMLALLGVTTTGLTNMAQLLNLVYILPGSYRTLVCPNNDVLLPVYLANNTVNSDLIPVVDNSIVQVYTGPNNQDSYQVMKFVIPPDQALAAKAFTRGLQQIKGITNSTLPAFSKAMALVETNTDLPAVNALTTPVPDSVKTLYTSGLGSGSGPRGTLLLTDVLGVLTSSIFTLGFTSAANSITNTNTAALTSVYQYMANTQAGDYNDPMNPGLIIIPSGPAAGTYTGLDDAFSAGLIPAANSAIANIANANPDTVSSTNTTWTDMTTELAREASNQQKALINFGTIYSSESSNSSGLSFASGLHQYGTEVEPGQANEVLTALANMSTLSGQCIIASLREGRNLAALQDANIDMDTQLPAT
jgi:hypothetical protein